eukprot:scaffold78111_cov60-Phaeocystis_antarctica.AAC.1
MECFQLAQEAGATAFSMGRKHRKGRCSVELLPFACDNYKQWKVRAPLSPSTHACHLADPDARVAWPPPRTPSVRRPPHPKKKKNLRAMTGGRTGRSTAADTTTGLRFHHPCVMTGEGWVEIPGLKSAPYLQVGPPTFCDHLTRHLSATRR